jgi:hypothetical protein
MDYGNRRLAPPSLSDSVCDHGVTISLSPFFLVEP